MESFEFAKAYSAARLVRQRLTVKLFKILREFTDPEKPEGLWFA
ncbi:MAG: hypothetical protein ACI4CY_07310 [Candidatus Gastranaerophilaceae bacterium]